MTTKVYKNLIGGKWVNAATGKTFLNHNPANVDDVVGEFQASGVRKSSFGELWFNDFVTCSCFNLTKSIS